jgi:transcriptional regulator with XRE-family HTH domain
MKDISTNRIKELRESRGWTQEKLAALVGINQSYLSALERGTQEPTIGTCLGLATIFGVPVEEIYPQPAQIILRGEYACRRVWLDGQEITPAKSLAVFSHSPSGFAWGYGGSGPAQLALAVLLELVDKKTALRWHQEFKDSFISVLPEEDFEMPIPPAWMMRIAPKRVAA